MTSELTFRAQLVIREQRQLYDYWLACAAARHMPARRDLDPVLMRRYLPFICLIDIDDGLPTAFVRLAGTRVREIYGFELTGKWLGDLEWGEKADYWRAVYRRIVEKCAPLQGAIQGPISDREHIMLLWLRLPLSDDGDRVNKILCYDVPLPRHAALRPEKEVLAVRRVANG